ncbi:MAG: hypothetical protein K0Q83_1896 [Deltaproteobacteria bacterium]|nr:hypothetical protein [Deltaproteobacteria bacterium]
MTIGRGPEILRIVSKYYQCFDLCHGIDLPFVSRGLLFAAAWRKDNRRRVAEGAGIDLKQAKSLTPLPGSGTGREVPGKYLYERSVRSRPFAADPYGEKRG